MHQAPNQAVITTPSLFLEQSMLERGVQRYIGIQQRAANDEDLTKAEQGLFNKAFGNVVKGVNLAHLEEALKVRGRAAQHAQAMKLVDHELLAAIALKNTFNAAAYGTHVTDLCERIGIEVEVEMAVSTLRERAEKLDKALLKKTARTSKARKEKAEEILEAAAMESQDHVKLGLPFLNIVLQSVDIFHVPEAAANEADDGYRYVLFTPEAQATLEYTKEVQQWMNPVYQPILEKPKAWDSFNTGAYHDERVARTVPLMKAFNKDVIKKVDAAAKQGAPFVKALNAIQDVPLKINKRVLEALEYVFEAGIPVGKVPGFPKAIPEGTPKESRRSYYKDNEKIRAKRLAVRGAISEARIYADSVFYQPHQLDWRGRVYAKPGFNHQRADFCKGLYDLANGQQLDQLGLWWLKWHLATTGAFKVNGKALDKQPNEKRVAWVDENLSDICLIGEDPIGTVELWAAADSPFCYLAACCALNDYLKDPTGYVCHIPVAIDGSCSGLQHFSALLRDAHGGAFVNLIPGDEPADVYAEVASIVLPLVQSDYVGEDLDAAFMAAKWMGHGIDRKVAKRATMTFVYGSKQSGFADQLLEDIVDTDKGRPIFGNTWEEQKPACIYLSKHINTAVRQTVKAAADAMKWLQDVAGIMAKQNLPVEWVTPLGLPVTNAYYKLDIKRLEVTLWNRALNVPTRFRPSVRVRHTKELIAHKVRNSIAPNFVHSMDSAHLMSVVLKAKDEGINDFLLIHDSFACLPSQMSRFGEIVRETFVDLYENNEPLQGVMEGCVTALMDKLKGADTIEEIKGVEKALKALKKLSIPEAGTLVLSDVKASKYAFA